MSERPATLVIEREGKRAMYELPEVLSECVPLAEQIAGAISIKAKPLYAVRFKAMRDRLP